MTKQSEAVLSEAILSKTVSYEEFMDNVLVNAEGLDLYVDATLDVLDQDGYTDAVGDAYRIIVKNAHKLKPLPDKLDAKIDMLAFHLKTWGRQ